GTDAYTYDASSQVTGATHTSQANESLTYDANGNRTVSGYSTGTNNRLNSDGVYNYQYDAEGNRTRRTEIATGKYDLYAWDNHNRLTSVASYTSAGVLTKQVAYTYDVFDRRIGRQVDADGNGTYDTTQRFVYDGDDLVLAYNAAGALTNRYLVGPNVDEILADENGSGTVTWSLADNLGSVRDLAQYTSGTNTTTVVNHVVYDTFGQIKSQTNTTWQPLFAYTGREWDADAGLYYYRARWYDARVGRLLREDPLGLADGDVNLSRYVANSATMFVDPSGMEQASIFDGSNPTQMTPLENYDDPFGSMDDDPTTPGWPFSRPAQISDWERYGIATGMTVDVKLDTPEWHPPVLDEIDPLGIDRYFRQLRQSLDSFYDNTTLQGTFGYGVSNANDDRIDFAVRARMPLHDEPISIVAVGTGNLGDAILVAGYTQDEYERKMDVRFFAPGMEGVFQTNFRGQTMAQFQHHLNNFTPFDRHPNWVWTHQMNASYHGTPNGHAFGLGANGTFGGPIGTGETPPWLKVDFGVKYIGSQLGRPAERRDSRIIFGLNLDF
ncbi:MAG: RHS repeat-associated core domain-containing protein, partial [Planctomycetota bacterium]|nr:RHS repeat-associated core domain-containing protein [Planctomycetota bacterium]